MNTILTRSALKALNDSEFFNSLEKKKISPMLAHRFYNPNITSDSIKQQTNSHNYITYNGSSGSHKNDKWTFSKKKTIYYCNPKSWYLSEKLDGVRAIWNTNDFLTRNNNKIEVPIWLKDLMPKDKILDGELHCGKNTFEKINRLTSFKIPNDNLWKTITYSVFDYINIYDKKEPFSKRYQKYQIIVQKINEKWTKHRNKYKLRLPLKSPIESVVQTNLQDFSHAYQEYKKIIKNNGEGVILKNPNSIYEYKRTKNMLKWKPSLDGEAKIIGYVSGSNKFKNRLGKYKVQLLNDSSNNHNIIEFNLSGKLSHDLRKSYLFKNNQIIKEPSKDLNYPLIGDIITFSFMTKTKDGVPRQAIYERIRKRNNNAN